MDPGIVFTDRRDAGRRLAERLRDARLDSGTLVCGIPRGGVVVAAEVARALGLRLRAVVAKKVGAPGHPELAIGAVGPDGSVVVDEDLCRRVGATPQSLEGALEQACAEVAARIATLPSVVDADSVRGQTVLVVDDGVATGATAAAVGRWLAHAGAARRVLALPCGPPDTLRALHADYDEVIAITQPDTFVAVGQWYRSFTQTSDAEVTALLEASD